MSRTPNLKMKLIPPIAGKFDGKNEIFHQKRALASKIWGQVGANILFYKMLGTLNLGVKWLFVTPSTFFAISILRLYRRTDASDERKIKA